VRGRLIEHDRDGAVIHELDVHVRAEHPALDLDAEGGERGAESLVERLGKIRRRRVGEARPIPLTRLIS
jgi:hypothetical protein